MEYKPRKIAFKETIEVNDWSIKVYIISKNGDFQHPEFYEKVKQEVSKWLLLKNSFDASNEKIGFLILHSGTEGIFSVMNWWVGKNMMNTHIFLTQRDEPIVFTPLSGDGLAPCVWELEVINHERVSWMNNFLKKESHPDIEAYLGDVYNGMI